MFFTSPRNSIEAHLSLLKESKASAFIVTSDELPVISKILKQHSLEKIVIPELEALLSDTPVEVISFNRSFEDYRHKPFLLLHTSGSTGIPKIITIRHGYTTTMDGYSRLAGGSEVVNRVGGRRIFNPFPPFHMAGIMWSLPIVCWVDSTIVLPPPIPITASLANEIHVHGNVSYSTLMPSVIVDLAKNEEYLANISKLEGLGFAGGPLPKATGEIVSRKTTIHASYGSTEMMAPPVKLKKRENWQYLHFDIPNSGIEFRRQDDSNEFELVIVRKPQLELLQAIFITFPDLNEYHTKDLFTPHPTEHDHWLYASRLDDIIVFSNGEKLNPVTMESIIVSGCAEVTGALVFGQGKFQSGLLVEAKEPPSSNDQKRTLLESIWPTVQKANQSAVGYGKISKDFIIFTTSAKPMLRAGKGTVQRARSVSQYKGEIDQLYDGRLVPSLQETSTLQLDLTDLDATKASLKQFFADDADLEDISLEDDIFRFGFDSLQAANLSRTINASLERGQPQIETRQIYENPTIGKLANMLHSQVPTRREDDDDLDTWTEMQQRFYDLTSTFGRTAWSYLPANPPRLHLAGFPDLDISDDRGFFETQAAESGEDSERSQDTSRPFLSEKQQYDETSHNLYIAANDKQFLYSMVPPDGGLTAWTQVLASFLININTFGLSNTFGAYQEYYSSGPLASYSFPAISIIGTLQASLLLIIGVLSGPSSTKASSAQL